MADTVDQTLTEGDAMNVKAFDDGTIPDTETLSLTHLPDQVRWLTVTVDPAKLNQFLLFALYNITNKNSTIKFTTKLKLYIRRNLLSLYR